MDRYVYKWMYEWIWTAALGKQMINGLLYQKFRITNKKTTSGM